MSKTKSSKHQKTPLDLKASQDARLTSKHIQTLIKLDDVVAKNLELESKVNVLEQEISSCYDLHKQARDAQKCQIYMNAEHEIEVKRINEDYVQKMKLKEEEFQKILLDTNTLWEGKVSSLNVKVENLEKTLKTYEKEKYQMSQSLQKSSATQAEFETSREKVRSYEIEIDQLRDVNKNMESQMTELQVCQAKLVFNLASLEKELDNNTKELKKQLVLNKRLMSESKLIGEIDKLSEEVDALKLENEGKNEEIKETNQNYEELKKMMEEMKKEHFLIKIERDTLNQSLNDLNLEYHALKEKHSPQNVQTFSKQLNSVVKNTKSKLRDKQVDKSASRHMKKGN